MTILSGAPPTAPHGLVVEHGREHGRSPGPFGPTNGWRTLRMLEWMRVGDGRCPNSFRATGDNSTAYAGSFGDYNTATATGDNSVLTQAAAGVTGDTDYEHRHQQRDGTRPLPSLASSPRQL